jgi:ketosteroid isomerase-like protein
MNDPPILEYEAQLRRAQLGSDVVALTRLLDDALVFTALDGSVVGKNDDLSLHRSGRLRIIKMEPHDCRVLDLGDVTVVSVKMQTEAILDGVKTQGPLRYTRVWRKGAVGWRIVAGHMSAIAPKDPTADSVPTSPPPKVKVFPETS